MVKTETMNQKENETIFSKEAVLFIKQFRKHLQSGNKILALNEFINRCKTNSDIIKKYMRGGGSVFEIIKCLEEAKRKSDVPYTVSIFSALYHIIEKSLTDDLYLQSDVEDACDTILDKYNKFLQSIITDASCRGLYKRPIFNIFTAMVRLSLKLARKILQLFSFDRKVLGGYVRNSKNVVRVSIIRLVLAYLEEGNTVLVSDLLDKHFLLTSILSTLNGDEIDIQKKMLILLLEKVVKNSSISKTIKMRIFNTHVLQSLVCLYDAQQNDENYAIPNAVHNLLMLLCTSTKLGILFHEENPLVTDNERISNKLVFSCLASIKAPWDDVNLKGKLVCEVISKTGLIGLYIRTLMAELSSKELEASIIYFIVYVVTSVNYQSDILKLRTGYSYLVVSNCILPTTILSRPEFTEDYFAKNVDNRISIIFFLRSCLTSLKSYLTSVKELDLKGKIKNDEIQRHLYDTLPRGSYLTNAWNRGPFDGDKKTKLNWHRQVSRSNYYEDLIYVIEAYNVFVPRFIDCVRYGFVTFDKLNVTSYIQLPVCKLFVSLCIVKPDWLYVLNLLLRSEDSTDYELKLTVLQQILERATYCSVSIEECVSWLHAFNNFSTGYNKSFLIKVLLSAFDILRNEPNMHRQFNCVVSNDLCIDDRYFTAIANEINDYPQQMQLRYCKISPLLIAFLHALRIPENTSKWKQKEIIRGKLFVKQLLTNILYFQESTDTFVMVMQHFNSKFIPREFVKQQRLNEQLHISDDTLLRKINVHKSKATMKYLTRFNDSSELILFVRRAIRILLTKIGNEIDDDVIGYGRFVADMFDVVSEHFISYSRKCCVREYFQRVPIMQNFMETISTQNGDKFNVITHVAFRIIKRGLNTNDLPLNRMKIRFMMFACHRLIEKSDFVENTVCSNQDCYPDCLLIDLPAKFLNIVVEKVNKKKLTKMNGWYNLICRLLNKQLNSDSLQHIQHYIVKRLHRGMDCSVLENNLRLCLESYPIVDRTCLGFDFVNTLLEAGDSSSYELLKSQCRLDCNLFVLLLSSLRTIERFPLSSTSLFHLLDIICNYPQMNDDFRDYAQILCELFISLYHRDISTGRDDGERLHQLERVLSNWHDANKVDSKSVSVLTVYFKNSEELYRIAEFFMERYSENPDEELLRSVCKCFRVFGIAHELLNWTYWKQFSTEVLNNGIKCRDVNFIDTLNYLIASATQTENYNSEINDIFGKMVAHSLFLDIVMSKDKFKKNIMQLYFTLVNVGASIHSAHLSLLFSIYEGTLQETDRIILQILYKYEGRGIIFNEYRPYLWGKQARMYYNVHSNKERTLLNQPSTTLVLDSLDMGLVVQTIENYPHKRSIRPINDDGDNDNFSCTYDPAFYLPLFGSILAPEMVANVNKFVRSGALALVVCSLCSERDDTRRAAYFCLSRFWDQLALLEKNRKKEYCIWYRFLTMLIEGMKMYGRKNERGRSSVLPCVSAVFYAHITLIFTRPYDPLFVPIRNYFVNNDVFRVNNPSFLLKMFQSTSHPNYKCLQKWILKILSCNTLKKSDYEILKGSSVMPTLMLYCNSSLCDQEIKTLILETLPKVKGFADDKISYALWLTDIADFCNSEEDVISIFKILKTTPPFFDVTCLVDVMVSLEKAAIKCNLTRQAFHLILDVLKSESLPLWLSDKIPFSILINIGRLYISDHDYAVYSRVSDTNEHLDDYVRQFLSQF